MAKRFFSKTDFARGLTEPEIRALQEKRVALSGQGKQAQYDVFLSHSTKDMD